jgi:four helix bundle protein
MSERSEPPRRRVSHFRDLRVWQHGMDVVESVYRVSARFPKAEVFALTAQIRRAAVSVPSNIAEGHTRASTKEYLNHISMAQASLAEVETQLEIAMRLSYISLPDLNQILQQAALLGKQLYALRDALLRRE